MEASRKMAEKSPKSFVKENPAADANQHSDRLIINYSLSCST
jgi:hypothetical protein